jgi:tripartite-type tricarboxylate transporter receptor subunit TctC
MLRKLSLVLSAAFALVSPAHAAYPEKPVNIIVPFSAGGGIDVLIRAIGSRLTARWKEPVVVENKVGAGSAIGTAYVARAQADGYTLLATVNQTMVSNRFLYKKLPYDPDKSFEPIIMMVKADQLIVANAKLPVNSLTELVALARSKPNTLNYGSYGNGSQPHLLFSMINDHEKILIAHIPYNGIAQSLTALIAGDVQLGTGSAAVVEAHIKSGKLKALAVAADARLSQFPSVPTTGEQGLPYAKISIWYALFAPAGTPEPVIREIRSAVKSVLDDPVFVEQQVRSKGLTVIAGDGKMLADTIRVESRQTAAMIKAASVVAE